jgi:hypothetical protein
VSRRFAAVSVRGFHWRSAHCGLDGVQELFFVHRFAEVSRNAVCFCAIPLRFRIQPGHDNDRDFFRVARSAGSVENQKSIARRSADFFHVLRKIQIQ